MKIMGTKRTSKKQKDQTTSRMKKLGKKESAKGLSNKHNFLK
jgi:hypothetical protein